jgi:hypothetical protein
MPSAYDAAGKLKVVSELETLTRTENTVYAGPAVAPAAVPTFRALVAADLPTIGATKGGTGQTTYATGDTLYASAANTLSKLAAGTNGHILTLAAGIPSWAAPAAGNVIPTATSWGENTETLSADKTLVDGDDTVQFLNCGTANRSVLLPVTTTSSPFFIIINNSDTTGRTLTLKSGVLTVVTIAIGEAVWCVNNGVAWVALYVTARAAGTTASQGVQGITWAGDAGTTVGRRLDTNYEYLTSSASGSDTAYGAVEMPSTGTIDRVAQVVQTNGNQVWAIYKNGASSETIASTSFTATGAYFTKGFDTNTSVTASDYISFVLATNTSTLDGQRVFAFLRGAGIGHVLRWGATMTVAGRHALPFGSGLVSSLAATDPTTEHIVGTAFSDVNLSHYTSAGSATTVFKVVKNGAVVDTLTCAGAVGVLTTVGTSYAALDGVTIEYDAGTAPSLTMLVLATNQNAIYDVQFGGNPATNANSFLAVDQNYNLAVSNTTATADNGYLVQYSSRLYVDAFNCAALSTETLALRKNGATDQTIDPASVEQVITLTGTYYYVSDYVEMTCSSSTANAHRHRIHFFPLGGF